MFVWGSETAGEFLLHMSSVKGYDVWLSTKLDSDLSKYVSVLLPISWKI